MANWDDHKDECEQRVGFLSTVDSVVEESYRAWRKRYSSVLSLLACALGGPDKDLLIAITLKYVPENPTETQFQIMSVNRLPPEHEVYIASTPMRQKNIMYGDNLSGNYIVTCPDLGEGLRMASVAVNGARMSPGDPASASAIVKSINDGSTGMTHKDRRISQAMFAANAETESLTTTYGSVAVCGGVGCTKKGVSLCSGCKVVNYCSKEYQVGHWRAHKEDCKKAAAHLARMKQDGDVAPAGRVPFNMTAIQSQVVAILAKADEVAKAYGLRSYHAFDSVHTTAKETGDYAPLTKLLEEKVQGPHSRLLRGPDTVVRF